MDVAVTGEEKSPPLDNMHSSFHQYITEYDTAISKYQLSSWTLILDEIPDHYELYVDGQTIRVSNG